MERISVRERHNWRETVEAQGFVYHSLDGTYWEEGGAYRFEQHEATEITEATRDLHQLCLEAVEHVVLRGKLALFGIPERFHPLVEASWRDGELPHMSIQVPRQQIR